KFGSGYELPKPKTGDNPNPVNVVLADILSRGARQGDDSLRRACLLPEALSDTARYAPLGRGMANPFGMAAAVLWLLSGAAWVWSLFLWLDIRRDENAPKSSRAFW